MDEIGISTVSFAATLDSGGVKELEIDPESYGFTLAPVESIAGGSATDNAAIVQGVLDGSLTGPKRDIVILNAAAALWVDGKARDMQEGIEMANATIDNGSAGLQIDKIAKISQQLA
jgi:anthranilate phosphoribosyltransferase